MSLPRRAALLAALLLCAAGSRAAGEPVVVHLKSGAVIRATLVAQDDQAVSLATADGTVRLPRSAIARIERPGARPSGGPPRLPAKPPEPPGTRFTPWPEADEKKVEQLLDQFFAAKDDAARKAVFAKLDHTPLGRPLEDLERMRQAAGAARRQKHVPVPWRKGAPRAWFNLALPKDYSPASAWPLVLALHGMPSDGDNLVSWYSRYFPPKGYIVLFPTTVHRSSFWPAPAEKRELLRLVRHVASLYRIDYRRIYCTGASGGGIGTWHWLATLPELFAGGISFSAAGTLFDRRLKKLKGVPFYVHHGTKDPIPIASVQRSIDMARKYGAAIELYASKGTGHTPPSKDFARAFDWLCKLPPKAVSPRALLESPEGELPTGYPRHLPFALTPDADAFRKTLAANKTKVARWTVPSKLPRAGLVEGMVAIARIVDPACDLAAVRRETKRIADAARKKAKPDAGPIETLDALNETFFHAEGFARDGADATGDEPEGLAVHHVLKRRVGNVLALTGLYAAVAAELGLPVHPVVSPYHAFARFDGGTSPVNVEMTEAGGHFDDAVYVQGYGLSGGASLARLKSRAIGRLLAAQLAALAGIARRAGDAAKAQALAKLALSLHPDDYAALLISAIHAKTAGRTTQALDTLKRLVRTWPAYAAPRLLEGELHQQAGSAKSAVQAYAAGIKAPLKPYGAAAAYNAELYYRTAALYHAAYDKARKARRLVWTTYHNKCNKALLQCMKLNPRHPQARALFLKMGGRFTPR